MTDNLKGDPMSDSNQRLIAWQAKTHTGRVKEMLDTLRPDMLEHYKAVVTQLHDMEAKARQALGSAGAQTILYVPYLNFARQLYKLSRQKGISGEAFVLAASILLDKWAARGLDADVLAAIRTDVFDVAPPTP
jgi:hypothetical protein